MKTCNTCRKRKPPHLTRVNKRGQVKRLEPDDVLVGGWPAPQEPAKQQA